MNFNPLTAEIRSNWLFTKEELTWMKEHEKTLDFDKLILAGKVAPSIVHQLKSRTKAKNKLPSFVMNEQVLFPPSLNLEQSSSEETARYKASLVNGHTFLDMTCGFGIDSFFLIENFKKGILIEQNEALGELVRHNYALLGKKDVEFHVGVNSLDFLKHIKTSVDLIYIDPARRDNKGKKVFKLADCEPDVASNLDLIFKHTNQLLIKYSPLLDIQLALAELHFVKHVYIISVENECKELLFLVEKNFVQEPQMHAIQLKKDKIIEFSFFKTEENEASIICQKPETYLYEPNASLLKSGAFKLLCQKFNVQKLHLHSHLYTSSNLVENFPGRTFEILGQSKVDKKALSAFVPAGKANLSVRNFPDSVEGLRKKLALKEGGDLYVFATTLFNESKTLIITKKL